MKQTNVADDVTRAAVDLFAAQGYANTSVQQIVEAAGVTKGAMQLIDEPRAEDLFQAMGPATIVSGGSGANTAVGAALLGARTGFVGKVHEDELGRLFSHDLKATGLRFVQLSVPATGPGEQMRVLAWFLRHHPAPLPRAERRVQLRGTIRRRAVHRIRPPQRVTSDRVPPHPH